MHNVNESLHIQSGWWFSLLLASGTAVIMEFGAAVTMHTQLFSINHSNMKQTYKEELQEKQEG